MLLLIYLNALFIGINPTSFNTWSHDIHINDPCKQYKTLIHSVMKRASGQVSYQPISYHDRARRIRLGLEYYHKAEKLCREALVHCHDPNIQILLARCLNSLGRFRESKAILDQLLDEESFPRGFFACYRNNLNQSNEFLDYKYKRPRVIICDTGFDHDLQVEQEKYWYLLDIYKYKEYDLFLAYIKRHLIRIDISSQQKYNRYNLLIAQMFVDVLEQKYTVEDLRKAFLATSIDRKLEIYMLSTDMYACGTLSFLGCRFILCDESIVLAGNPTLNRKAPVFDGISDHDLKKKSFLYDLIMKE